MSTRRVARLDRAEPRGSRRLGTIPTVGVSAAGAALLVTAAIVLAAWLTLGSKVAAALAVGLVGAVLADAVLGLLLLGRPRLRLAPADDGEIGTRVRVGLEVKGGRGPVWVRLEGQTPLWVIAEPDMAGPVSIAAQGRGVFTCWPVDLEAVTPLGLARVGRRLLAPVAPALVIGPRRRPWDVAWDQIGAGVSAPGHRSGEAEPPRGVRVYVPGDQPRMMHWPLTARTGELVVKDRDRNLPAELVVVADLLGPDANPDRTGAEIDEAAGRAAWAAEEALRRGWAVRLVTFEETGVHSANVETPAQVGYRMAVAMPGPIPGSQSIDGHRASLATRAELRVR